MCQSHDYNTGGRLSRATVPVHWTWTSLQLYTQKVYRKTLQPLMKHETSNKPTDQLSQKLFCLWTKVHGVFPWNAGRIAVDHISFRFWISGVVPEIKVESCQKWRCILDVFFALPTSRGPAFQKLYICYDPCLATRRMANILWGYSHPVWAEI